MVSSSTTHRTASMAFAEPKLRAAVALIDAGTTIPDVAQKPPGGLGGTTPGIGIGPVGPAGGFGSGTGDGSGAGVGSESALESGPVSGSAAGSGAACGVRSC